MYEPVITNSDMSLFIGLIVILLCFLGLSLLYNSGSPKSKKYRLLLTDMYVVGIIKQLADKDKVNLNKELSEFNRIVKKSNLWKKGLDSVIEDELKEKVSNTQEKSLSKKE